MNEQELDQALRAIGKRHVRHTTPPSLREMAMAVPSSTPARRRWLPFTKWRSPSMFNATKFVAGGAIVALAGGFLLSSALTQGPSQEPRSEVGSSSPSPLMPDVTGRPWVTGRHSLTVAGVPLSFEAPATPLHEVDGHPEAEGNHWPWEGLKDGLYISNDSVGPQDAEAIILWQSLPDVQPARPTYATEGLVRPAPSCLLDLAAATSAAALADAVARAPGTELVSGPSDVSLDGRPAKRVALTVVPPTNRWGRGESVTALGCNPAYFFGWDPSDGGAFWVETRPGDTITVWIVDVGGTLLFIEAETRPDAGAVVRQEIEDIIDSVRFE